MSELSQRFSVDVGGRKLTAGDLFQQFGSSQGGVDGAIDALRSTLTSTEAMGPVPTSDGRDFTMVNDHVAVQAVATGRLEPEICIVNAGTEPFIFDPTRFVLESARDTQRVSLPSRPMQGKFEPSTVDIGVNPDVDRVATRFFKDAGLFLLDTVLRGAVGMREMVTKNGRKMISTPVGAKWSPIQVARGIGGEIFRSIDGLKTDLVRPFIRHGSDYLPIVGNIMSLYEMVAGHHLLERDNPSSMPERALAGIGVIPGGRAVAGIGKSIANSQVTKEAASALTSKVTELMRRYSQNSAVQTIERSAAIRDVAWWAVSDAHEELAGFVDDRLDNEFTGPWNETMAYIKAL